MHEALRIADQTDARGQPAAAWQAFPAALRRWPGLPGQAKPAALYLWSVAGGDERRVVITYAELAAEIGASERAARRALDALAAAGLGRIVDTVGSRVTWHVAAPDQAARARLRRDPDAGQMALWHDDPLPAVPMDAQPATLAMPAAAAGDVARAYAAAAAAIEADDPDPAAIRDLARRAYGKLYRQGRHAHDAERLLLLRAAVVGMAHLGPEWLLTAAAARPATDCRNRLAYCRGALALAAWEILAGQRAESRDDQAAARAHLAALLARARVPAELLRRATSDEPGEAPP